MAVLPHRSPACVAQSPRALGLPMLTVGTGGPTARAYPILASGVGAGGDISSKIG